MKKIQIISPVGLKGKEINERMKELMGITTINENKSNSDVLLTKKGPDGKAYAIVRENHSYYIKTTDKTSNLIKEDFNYIGGLQNKRDKAYPSYAKAIKMLNLTFTSLSEAYNSDMIINVFEDDNLLGEDISGFSNYSGNGFSGAGNLDGNSGLYEEEETDEEAEEITEVVEEEDEDGLTEVEQAIDDMIKEDAEEDEEGDDESEPINEKKKV